MAKLSTKLRSPKAEAADPATASERLAELAAQAVELARVVAKNAAAPEAVLTELSHSADLATRRALVTNPATPLDVLHEIAKQFPEELLDNPALDVFLLENPTFFRDLPAPVLRAVVKRDNCSAGVLAQAAQVDDEVVLLGICQNPAATPETVRALRASTSAAVRKAAALHVAVAGAVKDWPARLRKAVARALALAEPAQRLRGLPFLRLAGQLTTTGVASSAALPPLFGAIIQDAAGAYSNAAVLDRLAGDEDWGVRRAVAEHPATPAALLERLAGDKESWVRCAVAKNPATPVALLERLAGDKDRYVRRAVAEHPAMPVALLERLAGDEDSDVRGAVAKHPATPVALLERLAGDEDRWVRRAVAAHPATPVALLERLAGDEESWVRDAVAEHPATPVALREQLLERLAGDKESWVRDAVARHPATPGALVERLAGD